jgi:hypothetical protein
MFINKYYTYKKGNIPLILLSLHDGSNKIHNCTPRKNKFGVKEFVLGNDSNTKPITNNIYNFFIKKNIKPYLLINNIKRSYADLNRNFLQGCNTSCELCFNYHFQFHGKLNTVISTIIKQHGKCLLIDIHGNKFTHNMLQFGYGVSKTNIFNKNFNKMSFISIKNKIDIKDYFYGEKSLSKYFHDNEFKIFPTYKIIDNQYLKSIKYYSGSKFIIKKFSGICDVVLLEISKNLRNSQNITNISNQIAKSLLKYYLEIYVNL